MVVTCRREVATKGQGDAHDITDVVAAAVAESSCPGARVPFSVAGRTAVVRRMEFERGAAAVLTRLLEAIAPRADDYRHHLRWGDDNGSSHVRAALLGPSLTVPFADAKPM